MELNHKNALKIKAFQYIEKEKYYKWDNFCFSREESCMKILPPSEKVKSTHLGDYCFAPLMNISQAFTVAA